jgi:hypothetical protein
MREICTSGSEGGAGRKSRSYLYLSRDFPTNHDARQYRIFLLIAGISAASLAWWGSSGISFIAGRASEGNGEAKENPQQRTKALRDREAVPDWKKADQQGFNSSCVTTMSLKEFTFADVAAENMVWIGYRSRPPSGTR